MRGFILGGLMASLVWVFFSLGGATKLERAMADFHETEMIETAKSLATEREDTFNREYRGSPGCTKPVNELKRLECKNQMNMARASFYARWNRTNADRFPK